MSLSLFKTVVSRLVRKSVAPIISSGAAINITTTPNIITVVCQPKILDIKCDKGKQIVLANPEINVIERISRFAFSPRYFVTKEKQGSYRQPDIEIPSNIQIK